MQYGLKQNTIESINKVFSKYQNVYKAVLYGSRAKGVEKQGSDIDLTLKGKNLNLEMLNKISLDLDDLYLPYMLDISIYDHIDNPDLIEHINRVGKVFYKKETGGT